MKKGFTLVELLIVIGILAVLSTATVLILNPAQILSESRDTQRLNDLNTLSSALSLMLATVTDPDLSGETFLCGTNFGSSIASGSVEESVGTPTQKSDTEAVPDGLIREVNGGGWMAAVLTSIPGGAPLAVLPQDPTNSVANNYQYYCNDTVPNKLYELNATAMESAKYQTTAQQDGGDQNTGTTASYEVGNSLTL